MRKKDSLQRSIVYIVIILGIVLSIFYLSSSWEQDSQEELFSERRTKFFMGTVVEITIYGDEKQVKSEKTDIIFGEVFDEIEDLEDKFTRGKIKGGDPVALEDEVLYVVKRGVYFSEISEGGFDITIGPVAQLWNIRPGEENLVPLKRNLDKALSLVDYKKIDFLGDNVIQMNKEGMFIDFGGIAKGYIADRCSDILKENGVEHAIINLGGNVYALGTKPVKGREERHWNFGIQDPFLNRGDYLGVVKLKDQSLVTSGIYERYFEEDGQIYHHIFDPKTGYPIDNELLSVTIITDNSLDADALSTAVFAAGIAKGMTILENYNNAEGIFVTKDNEIFLSSGVKADQFVLTKDEKYTIIQYPGPR